MRGDRWAYSTSNTRLARRREIDARQETNVLTL
jgi:hypothetical protein